MELRHLRYFLAVSESKSLTKAADIVHVTQPAISRQIKDLEDELGASLFIRNSNGVALTEAGVIFLSHSRKILAQSEAAAREISDRSKNPCKAFRVGFDHMAGGSYLIKAFHALGMKDTRIEIDAVEQNDKAILQQLSAGSIDVGLLTMDQDKLPTELDSVAVVQRPGTILLANGVRSVKDKRVNLKDLQYFPLIVVGDSGRSHLDQFAMDVCRRADMTPASILYTPSRMAMYGLIAANRGFGIVPDDPDLDLLAGQISRFSVPKSDVSVYTCAVWPRNTISPAREAFVDLLLEMTCHLGPSSRIRSGAYSYSKPLAERVPVYL